MDHVTRRLYNQLCLSLDLNLLLSQFHLVINQTLSLNQYHPSLNLTLLLINLNLLRYPTQSLSLQSLNPILSLSPPLQILNQHLQISK